MEKTFSHTLRNSPTHMSTHMTALHENLQVLPIQFELRNSWVQKDKKRIFLGRYSSRNLQVKFEQATLPEEKADMGFDDMMTKFRDRF